MADRIVFFDIDGTLLALARLIADRYVHSLGEVLRAMLPASSTHSDRDAFRCSAVLMFRYDSQTPTDSAMTGQPT